MKLYSMPSSGNSYKVRLLLALLGQDYQHIACEAESAELLKAKDAGHLPLGKLPALHLADGNILTESGAILWYLAQDTAFLPQDRILQAAVLEWMFFEQNRMEPVIAVRAALRTYPHRAAQATPERLEELLLAGNALFQLLDGHLSAQDWLVGGNASIADIALYGYVHSSGSRGGYDMAQYPAILRWCAQIADMPGYVTLEHEP